MVKSSASAKTSSSFFAPRRSVAKATYRNRGDNTENDKGGQPMYRVCGPLRELPPLASGASWKTKIRFLTPNRSSWILHVPKFCCSSSQQLHKRGNSSLLSFKEFWKTHPHQQHSLMLFGRKVLENRYSAMYSKDETIRKYTYSGSSRPCKVCDVSQPHEKFISDLFASADAIAQNLLSPTGNLSQSKPDREEGVAAPATPLPHTTPKSVYNACLVNWYAPEHTIGLHSDDEPELDTSWPIFSLSWGGPRRFLLRPKSKNKRGVVHEVLLKDGDLLVMGGNCQDEFKHEIPKVRSTKDGLVGNRISWTIRRMRPSKKAEMAMKSPSQVSVFSGPGGEEKTATKRNYEESSDTSSRTMTRNLHRPRKKKVIYNPYARASG